MKPSRSQFVEKMLTLQGLPYVYGARGPHAADCSGIGAFAYFKAGGGRILHGWWTDKYFEELPCLDPQHMKPGDCILYGSPGNASHMTWFLGDGFRVMNAARGNRHVTTVEIARKKKAFTRIEPTWNYRPDVLGFRSMAQFFAD